MTKSATIKVKLSADSGYECTMEGRIDPEQWAEINRVIDGKPKPDVSFCGGPAPTHYCKECGAMWRRYGDVWNLRSKQCGPCCDNVTMGDQIIEMGQPS